VQEKKFTELTPQKAKIEKIKIRTSNSAQLIQTKIAVASMDDSYVLHLFWFRQTLSFLHIVCNSRPSVPTSVNRYKN
jgi:hypothetical protein